MKEEQLLQRQLGIEMESVQIGIKSYQTALRKARKKGNVENMKPESALIRAYMNPFLSGIHGEKKGDKLGLIRYIREGHGRIGGGVMSRKYIKDMSPMEVAFVVLRTVFNSVHEKHIPLLSLAKSIGKAVNDHAGYIHFKEVNPRYFENVKNFVRMKSDDQKRIVIKNRANTQEDSRFKSWGDQVHKNLGIKLLSILCACTKVGYKQTIYNGNGKLQGKGTDMFVPYPVLVDQLEEAHRFHEIRQPAHLPMIVPPLDWTNERNGGHYGQEVGTQYKLVGRNKESFKDDPKLSNLQPIMDACNKLQSVPWKINTRILEIIKEIRNQNGGIAGVVSLEKSMLFDDAPVKPWSNDEEMERIKKTNYDLYKKTMRPYMLRHEAWARNVSKRSGFNKQIEIADKFKDDEAIYFCYTAEWRGRINCKQNHVSPQADDVGKSLLLLANGLPIGNNPLSVAWFKRHGAGCFAEKTEELTKAVDKLSFSDREAWVDRHEAEILADAANPWRNDALWLKADKCLQYLAWTFEYAAWIESGRSPEFVNHIACAQDGSCSGLQHISAMLRDEVCAFEVNLMNHILPNDIYGKVAEVIIPYVHQDALGGHAMAKLWDGKIDRGCCKAAVMTFVYGAKDRTYVKQLLELLQKYEDKGKRFIDAPDEEKFNACTYLKEMISRGMREVIVKGTQFMDWMQEVAGIFGKADVPMTWTMPDGVKVGMSYRRQDEKRVHTYWGDTKIRSRHYTSSAKTLANARMKNGVAANYIHSYDACHLRTVINEFDHDIVVIHDSFGALPCVSAELHTTLQETFMSLYNKDRIAEFIDELQPLVDEELPVPPTPGTWKPSEILQADYSFA